MELAWQSHLAGEGTPRQDRLVAEFAAGEGIAPTYLHPGMCLTSLPVRSLPDPTTIWRVQNGEVARLTVKPERDDDGVHHGVPFGTKARLIMLFLMDRAIKNSSPRIELGRSLNDWLTRMGAANGGTDYAAIRQQLRRIRYCRMSLELRSPTSQRKVSAERAVISSDISDITEGEGRGERELLVIELGLEFFHEVLRYPMIVQEAAIRTLSDHCRALDLYLWLSFRLPYLQEEVQVSWAALHTQFGAEIRQRKHFRWKFIPELERALRAYPAARVKVKEEGLELLPSPSPMRAVLT